MASNSFPDASHAIRNRTGGLEASAQCTVTHHAMQTVSAATEATSEEQDT
jgi:hypothetical protein